MRRSLVALILSLFVVGCVGALDIPRSFWQDANEPCEDGELYDYRGSTCPAPDVGSS